MNCELIKVCGMRDADNIRTLDLLGIANWMGFIFYPASSRYVETVPEYMPRHSRRVGVFVNATIEDIIAHCADYGLNAVQLHGDETPDYCSELRQQLPTGTAIIKAISVSSEEDLQRKYVQTVIDAGNIGQADIKSPPGGQADIGLHGQIRAYGKQEQPKDQLRGFHRIVRQRRFRIITFMFFSGFNSNYHTLEIIKNRENNIIKI